MKRISTLFTLCFFILFSQDTPSENYLKMRQGFTYFGHVYQKVTDNFVEEIDPLVLIKSGIRGMLSDLDPYTEFFDETNSRRLDLITTGKYGGIGIEIAQRTNGVMVVNVVENSPAYREKIKSGDFITHIDEKYVLDKNLDEVSHLLKGHIGEKLTLKLKNSISNKERTILLAREEIKLYDIPYFGFLNNETPYIKLSGFSENAPTEMLNALTTLKTNRPEMNQLILDLRNNPGGLLESARQIVNLFVPRGELILTTYGKREGYHRIYATDIPKFPNLQLIVLINKYSASASEIVAGALQDLDRAIVLGEESYGKGLVQKIFTIDPNLNIKVKITTAKYFTPSGRSIQKYNVLKKENTEKNISFYTRNGRKVKSGCGISPDVHFDMKEKSPILKQLIREHYILDYSLNHVANNKNQSISFKDFVSFLKEKNFSYAPEGVSKLNEFLDIADKRQYPEEIQSIISNTITQLNNSFEYLIYTHQKEISNEIEKCCAKLTQGVKGEFIVRLQNDPVVEKASELLENSDMFYGILIAHQ